MNLQENISTRLRRRTNLLDRVIKNLLPNMYPCDFNSSDHFVEGVIDEIRWFLLDVEELQGIERADIVYYIIDYKYDELTEYFNERCVVLKNDNLQESIRRILREETEVPTFLRRRFSSEDLEWLVNDVKELIHYGESLDTAIYDGTREFIKSRKFPDIYEFGPDADYWESYLRYERPLVDYVKKKLRITDNVNESILREELSPRVRRRVPYDDLEREFSESLEMSSNMLRNTNKEDGSIMSLNRFIDVTISILMDGIHYELYSTMPEDSQWYDDAMGSLKDYYKDRIKSRYKKLVSNI